MPARVSGTLVWRDRRGGSHVAQGDAGKLARCLPFLRSEASLLVGSVEVGRVYHLDGTDTEDRRRRWGWYYDPLAVGEHDLCSSCHKEFPVAQVETGYVEVDEAGQRLEERLCPPCLAKTYP